jgi:hypothetical protein
MIAKKKGGNRIKLLPKISEIQQKKYKRGVKKQKSKKSK